MPQTKLKGQSANFDKVRLRRSGNQTINNNSVTVMNWDVEDFDSNGMHDNAVSFSKVVIKRAGTYDVRAIVYWDANTSGVREAWIRKNGGAGRYGFVRVPAADYTGSIPITASDIIELAAGDEIEVMVYQNRGGDLAITADASLDLPSFVVAQRP